MEEENKNNRIQLEDVEILAIDGLDTQRIINHMSYRATGEQDLYQRKMYVIQKNEKEVDTETW